jgi:hypothetical protein
MRFSFANNRLRSMLSYAADKSMKATPNFMPTPTRDYGACAACCVAVL